MSEPNQNTDVLELVVEIVSSYVSNNSVPAAELPGLLNSVHESLQRISGPAQEAPPEPLTPAVPIRKSVTDEYIICLENGKPFKSLKRHLQTVYGMTPDQYRQRWGLSRDYPMVAPAYAKARSALAKGMGLGASRRKEVAEDAILDESDVDVREDAELDLSPENEAAIVQPDQADAEQVEPKKARAPRKKASKDQG